MSSRFAVAGYFPPVSDTHLDVYKRQVLLSAAVGAAVYLVGLLLLRALKKEDIMMLPKGEKMAKILEKYSLLG